MKKVAQLKPVKAAAPAPDSPRQLPRALEQVQQRTGELLGKYLAGMLDGADDTLFDLAESATDTDRDRYFDAMRELRVKRAGMETGFRQALHNSFRALQDNPAEQRVLDDQDIDIDSLTLVNEDELETGVAIDNMARRVRGPCEQHLRAFNHRLEYLFEGRREFGERRNPLEPRQVAECFHTCVEKLDLDIRSKLIVFKLFERMVLSEIGFAVSEANQLLIDAGVLPDMKAPPIRPARQPGQARSSAAAGAGASHSGAGEAAVDNGQVFGVLQELLSAMRSIGGGAPSAGAPGVPGAMPAGMPAGGFAPAVPGPTNMAVMHNGVPFVNGAPLAAGTQVNAVNSEDLLQMLNRLQRVERSLESQATPGALDEVDVRAELADLLETEAGADAVHALDQADDDVINLVSMLFDFILDDQGLSTDIKALLGRLQIPLLKVAIADKTFFSNDDHPARQLLNTLARAGAQWSPDQGSDDPLYQQIEQSVFSILNDYDEDVALFGTLLRDFEAFFSQQSARTERVEARIREVEEGRARAEIARLAVTAALDQRMAGRQLPDVAVRLLRQGWQQVLYLTHLREGEDSEAWVRDSKVVDAVVWSVLPHREQEALERLRALSPKLLNSVKAGLDRISYDALEANSLLTGLQTVHESLLRGLETERVPVAAEQPQVEAEVAVAPVEAEVQLPADHPQVRALRGMRPGQWVEFADGDLPQSGQRCKLAANLRGGDKLVFINRRGIKVCEHSAMSLAVALQQGAAKLIEDSALFDRALEAVIGDLRKLQQRT